MMFRVASVLLLRSQWRVVPCCQDSHGWRYIDGATEDVGYRQVRGDALLWILCVVLSDARAAHAHQATDLI
jgi:hypothetical protein